MSSIEEKRKQGRPAGDDGNDVPPETPAVRRESADVDLRRGYLRLLFRILIIAAVAWVMLTQVFLLTRAKGNGMFPSVKDGDLLICFRLPKEYAKNDVVVYEKDGKLLVGRIAAMETDFVELDESGSLRVNGTNQAGEILYPTYPKKGIAYPYQVPKGCVFILGDYRTRTKDSRDFGPITLKDVKGKVITLLRRRGI